MKSYGLGQTIVHVIYTGFRNVVFAVVETLDQSSTFSCSLLFPGATMKLLTNLNSIYVTLQKRVQNSN